MTESQEYPDDMVKAILTTSIKQEAKERDPLRFEPVYAVFFAQPSDDHESWRDVLTQVRRTFGTTTARSTTLKPGQDLCKKIERLLPWEAARIQIASNPMIRRLPMDIAYTRCSASAQ